MGEYSALCAGAAISFETTIILKLRGKSMQLAVSEGSGGMVAVLGSEIDKIQNLIKLNLVLMNVLLQTTIQMVK